MFDFKTFRAINNLTQKEAAAYFDVSQAFISQVENRTRPMPDEFISKIKADGKLIIPERNAIGSVSGNYGIEATGGENTVSLYSEELQKAQDEIIRLNAIMEEKEKLLAEKERMIQFLLEGRKQ
jgi:transcriptional regulator with XRE-family HTH domain